MNESMLFMLSHMVKLLSLGDGGMHEWLQNHFLMILVKKVTHIF